MSLDIEPPNFKDRNDVVAKAAKYMMIHLVLKARPDAPDEEILEVVDKLIDRYPFESELMWFMDEFDWCEFEQYTWPRPDRKPRYWAHPPDVQ